MPLKWLGLLLLLVELDSLPQSPLLNLVVMQRWLPQFKHQIQYPGQQ